MNLRAILSSIVLLAPLSAVAVGCAGADNSQADLGADELVGGQEDAEGAAEGISEDELQNGGQLACAVSQVVGTAALVGTVACWGVAVTTAGAPAPICIWMSTAGVTAAKVANSTAQCVTGCGLAGKVCAGVVDQFNQPRIPTTARIHNVGCTKRGEFVAEADVCGLGLNRIYARDSKEGRTCRPGKPTGFWALSDSERAYIRDRRNCAARGFR
jgi:hypothetical protein